MLRKSIFLLALLCLAAWFALTVGCGSSSAPKTKACTGTFNVVGNWNLTLNGAAGEAGVIDTTGLTLFFDSFGDVVSFPGITGACSFTGNATIYATGLGGGGTGTATVTGNVNSDTSISGTATATTGSTPFTAAPPASPLITPVAAVSGSMLGEIQGDPGADIWQFAVTATDTGAGMTFSGPNVGSTCTLSGSLTQEGTTSQNLNVFSSSMTFTGTGCPFSGTLTGLGLESTSDYFGMNGGTAGTYLYAMASSAPVVLEIFSQGLPVNQSQRRLGPHFRF